ncbi:hypothetical protein Avbf_16804 [Armadillidium vulgare]|nr:hypothetical protein Avbf_16804 [Armadillidium vulgare]
MQRRKSQSQKKTWEAVKQIATEVVWKKCNSSTQTNSVRVTDKCTQTRDVYISPLIESNEYLDWFDEEDGNSQESSEFDLQKFEKSLLFPEQSYTLGTIVSSISSIEDTSIDFIAKELGIRTFVESEDSEEACNYLDNISTPNSRVKSINEELEEVEDSQERTSEPIGLLESKEHEENSRNSLPKTRSRGPVLDAPNVQEKILEYRGKDRSKEKILSKCPTKSNSKLKLSNLEDSKWKTFKSNCVVNIELLKSLKINKTSDPVRTGISTVARNISIVTRKFQYRGQTASVVARERQHFDWRIPVLWPVNDQHCGQEDISIAARKYQCCIQTVNYLT